MNQLDRIVDVHLAAQPGDVHIDHVVERRRPRRLLPDVAGERLARNDLPLVAKEVFDMFIISF